MPGGGFGWNDPQTVSAVSERYATKAEHDALERLCTESFLEVADNLEKIQHYARVSENGYRVLYREHERDLIVLRRQVWLLYGLCAVLLLLLGTT